MWWYLFSALFVPHTTKEGAKNKTKMLRAVSANNDGSSYMFFTMVTLLFGCVITAIHQQAHTHASRIVHSIVAALVVFINMTNLISLFWRLWVRQEIEVSAYPSIWTRAWSRFPWQIVRAADAFFGTSFAWSFVFLTVWVWSPATDRNLHYTFCNQAGCQNIWGAWNMCISQAFAILVAGYPELSSHSQLAITLTWIAGAVS